MAHILSCNHSSEVEQHAEDMWVVGSKPTGCTMNIISKVVQAAGGPNKNCYPVSEALQYLLGKDKWKPEVLKYHGNTHWYLRNRITGEVLDATASQYKHPEKIPYHKGKGCGFLTKNPCKRTQLILDSI